MDTPNDDDNYGPCPNCGEQVHIEQLGIDGCYYCQIEFPINEPVIMDNKINEMERKNAKITPSSPVQAEQWAWFEVSVEGNPLPKGKVYAKSKSGSMLFGELYKSESGSNSINCDAGKQIMLNVISWLEKRPLPVGYSRDDMKNAFEAGESLEYFRDMGDKEGFHDLGKPKEFSEFIYPPSTAVGVHGKIYTTDEVWKMYSIDPRYGDLSYSQFAKDNGWVMIKNTLPMQDLELEELAQNEAEKLWLQNNFTSMAARGAYTKGFIAGCRCIYAAQNG